MSNDNILWTAITKARPPKVRAYYHVQDITGNKAIAFLNQNRTWTVVSGPWATGTEIFMWAFMEGEGGWARLKQYMKDVSTEYVKGEWSVADGYQITYEGRPVVGVNNAQLVIEDVWGGHDYKCLDFIDWSEVEVFKRLEVW